MLIKFNNLGKIKETELDLRPLTIIIGPNNSNKTYIAYSVYALWEQLGDTCIQFHWQKDCFSLPIDTYAESFAESFREDQKTEEGALNLETFFQDSSHKLFADTKTHYRTLF